MELLLESAESRKLLAQSNRLRGSSRSHHESSYLPAIAVTIADSPWNARPLAQDDDFRTYLNLPLEANVLANDTDPDADELKVVAVTPGENGGTVQISSDGKRVLYGPPSNTYGLDRFSYTVADARGLTAHASAVIHIVERTVQITSPNNGDTPTLARLFQFKLRHPLQKAQLWTFELLVNGISIATNFARPFKFLPSFHGGKAIIN